MSSKNFVVSNGITMGSAGINGVTITPATSATLTITSNKTLSVTNSITLSAGQDGQTYTLPSSSASLAPLASPTFTGTVVLPSTTSIGNVSSTEIGYVDGVTSSIQTQLDSKAPTNNASFTGTFSAPNSTITNDMLAGSIANTKLLHPSITLGTTTVNLGDTVTDVSVSTVETSGDTQVGGNLSISGNLTIDGNINVLGTTTTVNTAQLQITDNLLYLNEPVEATVTGASGNGSAITYDAANTFSVGEYVTVVGVDPSGFNISGDVTQANNNSFKIASTFQGSYVSGGTAYSRIAANPDLGFAGGYNDGTYHHAGFFRDATDGGTFKVFQGYVPEPDASVNIDTTHASFQLAPFEASTITASDHFIGNITGDVTGNVSGNAGTVTNGVYTSGSYSDPTWLSLTKSKVGLENVDNTSDANKPISTATQTALDGKATTSDITTAINALTTSDIEEGTRKYFTDQRALDATSTAYDVAGAASTVQGNLNTHEQDTSAHGVTGDVVGTSDSQTLTNKTISGSSNTISNIGNSSLTHSSITINGQAVDLGGSITVSGGGGGNGSTTYPLTIGTGLTGSSFDGSAAITIAIDSSVVTLTDTQTLTNKTFTAPTISGVLHLSNGVGTSGQILASTGTGLHWIDAPTGGGGGGIQEMDTLDGGNATPAFTVTYAGGNAATIF